MSKYFLLGVLCMVLLVPNVFGVFSDGIVHVFDFDGDLTDTLGGTAWNESGTLSFVSGVDGQAVSGFSGTCTNYISIPLEYRDYFDRAHNTTFSCWVNMSSASTFQTLWSSEGGGVPGIWGRYNDGTFRYNDGSVDTITYNLILNTPTLMTLVYYDNETIYFYSDGALQDTLSTGSTASGPVNTMGCSGSLGSLSGYIDQCILWNESLSSVEVANLNASGFYPFAGATEISFTAKDIYNGSTINVFSVLFNGTLYNTSNGTVNTGMFVDNLLYNVTFVSGDYGGYFNFTALNHNTTSSPLQGNLTKLFRLFDVSYSGFVNDSGVLFVNNLSYVVNLTCPDFVGNTNLSLLKDHVYNSTLDFTCLNESSVVLNGSYQDSGEGSFDIDFVIVTDYNSSFNNDSVRNETFMQDLYAPVVSFINLSVPDGFNSTTVTTNLNCTDNVSFNITYNVTYNSTQLFYGVRSNGSLVSNNTEAIDGDIFLNGSCSDYFFTAVSNSQTTLFTKELVLIDEITAELFDTTKVDSAVIYYDDNRTSWDFKSTGYTSVNFTSATQNKLRLELGYEDGAIITRYIDVGLSGGTVRLCANENGTTHNTQLILSSSVRPAILTSVYANCLVASDYTRFAVEDAKALKAFTIPRMYYLYTFDNDDNQFLLASVDGSIAGNYNLDTLLFGLTSYPINVLDDIVSFSKNASSNSTVVINYYNQRSDNTGLTVLITNLDSNLVVLNTSTISNPNNVNILFDYSTIGGVTNDTVFKIEFVKTGVTGGSVIKYFNIGADSGALSNGFALALSLLLVVFGLTFTVSRIVMSWFGLVIMLGAISVLAFAVGGWHITFMMVVEGIMALFIGVVMMMKNTATVA